MSFMLKKTAVYASSLISLVFLIGGPSASAQVNYSYNIYGESVPSQEGYSAKRMISGKELGCGSFNEPKDIFVDSSGYFFIADKGNDRIVEINSDFTEAIKEYSIFTESNGTETALSKPEGIFVSDDGYMYIADTGNSRILVSDMECNIKMIIKKPISYIYENETFQPLKVIADNAGNIYAVLNNVTGGAAFFSSSGKFEGYFGANKVELSAETVSEYFKKLFSTDKMRAASSRSTPAGITGFDIDIDGFVYTVTESSVSDSDRVKKLNAAGTNLFAGFNLVFGDIHSVKTHLTDIDVDDKGRICCLDMENGRVFQYDESGNLLFIMGERSERLGGFSVQPTAVEAFCDNIYVTDGLKNTVTVFEETDFGNVVHSASELYNDGRYEEALKPWQEALKLDGNNQTAYLGISSALLSKGDYKGAMEYADMGGSSYHYNKAFERYRAQWLEENFSHVIAVVGMFIAVCVIFRKYRKKRRKNLVEEAD